MPEIEIHPASAEDLMTLLGIENHVTGEYAWQMDNPPGNLSSGESTDGAGASAGAFAAAFRRVRLPRTVKIEYPRTRTQLGESLPHADMLLQAVLGGVCIGWCALLLDRLPGVVWISDLVVHPIYRRHGVGTGLVLATLDWASQWKSQAGEQAVILETPARNDPAVQFARKLGFEFSGYQNHYYGPHGLALFFYKSI